MIVKVAEADDRRRDSAETLMFLLIAGTVMLFATFTSAYLIRRAGADWARVPLPAAAWIAAGVLAVSSAVLHKGWLKTTFALGLVFAAVQSAAFVQLANAGVYVPTSPHAAFFAMLTGVHGVHVMGGLIGLGAAIAGRVRPGYVAVWWHFVGALWIYVLLMLWAL